MQDGGLGGGALTPGPWPHAPRLPAQLTGWLHPQPRLSLGSRREGPWSHVCSRPQCCRMFSLDPPNPPLLIPSLDPAR